MAASFLGERRESSNKINSLALIEFTYNFLLVYERVLSDLAPLPEQLKIAIGLRHAVAGLEQPVYLAYGRVDRWDYEADLDTRPAQADEFYYDDLIPIENAEPRFDIGEATHRLIVRLYNWFGFTDDAVPYTNDEGTAVVEEQIKNP